MTHRERIANALAGKPTDRVPFGFWRHYPNEDRAPRRLAELMVEAQRRLDLDFIKFMPYGLFSVVDWGVPLKLFEGLLDPPIQAAYPVRKAEDWAALKPIRGDEGEYAVVLEAQRLCLKELHGQVPFLQTVFSPLTSALKLAGEEALLRHLRDNPGRLEAGLEIISETTCQFAAAAVEHGADGLFFATQVSGSDKLSPSEFENFAKKYDFRVLEAVAGRSWFNMLHLHGSKIRLAESLDYPVEAFNWHDRDQGPRLAEARRLTGKCLVGGLGQEGKLASGSPAEAAGQVADAWRQLDGLGLIVGPGCVANTRTPEANIQAVKHAVEAAGSR
jgi:uroporphyrinogen decarboxylase